MQCFSDLDTLRENCLTAVFLRASALPGSSSWHENRHVLRSKHRDCQWFYAEERDSRIARQPATDGEHKLESVATKLLIRLVSRINTEVN